MKPPIKQARYGAGVFREYLDHLLMQQFLQIFPDSSVNRLLVSPSPLPFSNFIIIQRIWTLNGHITFETPKVSLEDFQLSIQWVTRGRPAS